MSENEPTQTTQVEPVKGSESFRKGADMLVKPPSGPVTDPSPIPVNMTPASPQPGTPAPVEPPAAPPAD